MILNDLINNEYLTSTERLLAEYIVKNYEKVLKLNSRELAKEIFVSPPTVIRLCKKLGFESYNEFKIQLSKETTTEYLSLKDINFNMPFQKGDSLETIVSNVSSIAISNIMHYRDHFDYEMMEAITEVILKKKFIDIYGIGTSLNSAREFCDKMTHIGYNVSLNYEPAVLASRSMNSGKHQVAIIISYSGYTKSMIDVAKRLKHNCTTIVVITGNSKSELLSYADYSLILESDESLIMVDKIDVFGILYMFHYIFDCLFAIIFSKNYEINLIKEKVIHGIQFE